MVNFKQLFVLGCCLAILTTHRAACQGLGDNWEPSPVIHTASGPVQGTCSDMECSFLGIPYAASTAQANRFKPPKARTPWTTIFNASEFGPGCYQTHHNPDVPKFLSEDCLNVNVYVPKGLNGTAMTDIPTMVFFHGGSFGEGSDQGPFRMYGGAYFAAHQEVIVVTANYRLGALGFVVIDAEIPGNMGLKDQVFALEWIHNNIKSFGGNPDKVTLWGESAGAMSVGIHLTNKKSSGLYSSAIMESNVAGFVYRTELEASLYGRTFCQLLNCTSGSGIEEKCSTECLQQKSTTDVGHAWNDAGNDAIDIVLGNWNHWLDAVLDFTPTLDNDWVRQPQEAIKAGELEDVPLLVGSNQDEGATFVYAGVKFYVPVAIYEALVIGIFGEADGEKIIDMYRNETKSELADGRDVFSNVLTDYWFRCGVEKFASAVSSAYVYRFRHVFSSAFIYETFGLPAVCVHRTCHASELPFVFQNSHNPEITELNVTFTKEELGLETTFLNYWGSFAKFHDPNQGVLEPRWPMWDSDARETMEIITPIPATSNTRAICEFWDSIGYEHDPRSMLVALQEAVKSL